MLRSRIHSMTESAMDDYASAMENESLDSHWNFMEVANVLDAPDEVGLGVNAGAGGPGQPPLPLQFPQPEPQPPNFDFITLPSFEMISPDLAPRFNLDSLVNNTEYKSVSNSTPLKLLKYSTGDLKGNLYSDFVTVQKFPFWNLNFSNKFPGTVSIWDVKLMQPSRSGTLSFTKPMPTTSFLLQDCLCIKGPLKTTHGYKANANPVVIIGDDFTPPRLGCSGKSCPMIVRVPCSGTLDDTLHFVQNLFSKKGKYSSNVPTGSVFLISLNSYIVRSSAQAFICMIFDFINKLGSHLERVFGHKYTILPLVFPVSQAYSGFDNLDKITDIMEGLITLRGEVDDRVSPIFDACISWYGDQWRAPPAENSPTTCTTNLFFPESRFLGLPKSTFTKGGDVVRLVATGPSSPVIDSSLKANTEAKLWSNLGEKLRDAGLDFPDEEEIALQYIMANRFSENSSYFSRFVTVTSSTERPIIIIGNSFGKRMCSVLSSTYKFSRIEFFEVRNRLLSDEYLSSLKSGILAKSKFISNNPIVIFLGLGNSLLKERENLSDLDFKVLGGNPIHIQGQVQQLSDTDFENILVNVRNFLQSFNLTCILFPPFP